MGATMITKRKACKIADAVLANPPAFVRYEGGRDLVAQFIVALDRAGAFEPADLPGLDAELVQARGAFVTAFCERMGWPTDPARLTSGQLFEIIDAEGWPK